MESVELLKLQEMLDAISKQIDVIAERKPEPEPYQSKDIKDLAAAFCVAQSMYPAIIRNSMGFRYMYADFSEVLKQVRRPLSDNGLSFYQFIEDNHGSLILHSRILHSSGQWLESRFKILADATRIKEFGSALGYLKREAALILLGIHPATEDDDGAEAMKDAEEEDVKGTDIKRKQKLERPKLYETVTKEQLEELEYELANWPDIAKDVMKNLDIRTLADMPKKDFIKHIGRIREIRHARSKVNS